MLLRRLKSSCSDSAAWVSCLSTAVTSACNCAQVGSMSRMRRWLSESIARWLSARVSEVSWARRLRRRRMASRCGEACRRLRMMLRVFSSLSARETTLAAGMGEAGAGAGLAAAALALPPPWAALSLSLAAAGATCAIAGLGDRTTPAGTASIRASSSRPQREMRASVFMPASVTGTRALLDSAPMARDDRSAGEAWLAGGLSGCNRADTPDLLPYVAGAIGDMARPRHAWYLSPLNLQALSSNEAQNLTSWSCHYYAMRPKDA